MATIQITADNFSDTVAKKGIVLLDWWAPWCGPCRAFGPVYERAAKANPDVVFGKINTEEERALAQKFSIASIPTLMVIRDGVLIFSQPGMLPEKALNMLVEEAKKLDMEAVKRGATERNDHGAVAQA